MFCAIAGADEMLERLSEKTETGICDECGAPGEVITTVWGKEFECDEFDEFEPDNFWGKCINQKCVNRQYCENDMDGGYVRKPDESYSACSDCKDDEEVLYFYAGCILFYKKKYNNLYNLWELFGNLDHPGLKRVLLFHVILPLKRRIKKNKDVASLAKA
jgi:hypothetical protein